MSLQNTNLLIQAAALPATFVGDPNAFFRAIIERMKIVSPSGVFSIFVGDTAPSSNSGPWLKGGTQWFVWDPNLKSYVPLDISASETHWFQTGANVPTVNDPPVWLRTKTGVTQPGTSQGVPIGWYLFDGTSWIGFTELLDREVTLTKMADGVRGALITYDPQNHTVLLGIGAPNSFLRVNAAGTDLEYRSADDIDLAGLLSAEVFGPLTDTTGYHPDTQSIVINLTEARDTWITVYAGFEIFVNETISLSLLVDSVEKDRATFHVPGGQDAEDHMATLLFRGNLASGNHTIVLQINNPAGGDFLPFVTNGNFPTVKFMVQLL